MEEKKQRKFKSHSMFGFRRSSSKNAEESKSTVGRECRRNRSVSFAISSEESCANSKSETLLKLPHHSTSPASSLRSNCHHHGSVMSLVMKQKMINVCGGTSVSSSRREEGMPRRPSTPSSLIRALISPRKSKGALSMLSLDESDTAVDSECSSSKRNSSSTSCSATYDLLPPSPWKSDNNSECEAEAKEEFDRYSTYFGRLIVNNAKPKGQQTTEQREEVLCAEGNTQYYLLSIMAPPGKKVVNIGRAIGGANNHSVSCQYKYNRNNLKISDHP